jgi:predicted lipoprotein with Yx(FWY)xxD motif
MRIRAFRWLLPLGLLAVAGAGAAMAATSTGSSGATVKAAKVAKFGMVLVSSSGKTLYRYTPDKKGKSVCSGSCAAFWPPLVVKGKSVCSGSCAAFWPPLVVKGKPTAGAGANSGLLGTVKRANGVLQVSYAGYPLYFYAGDKKAGDVKGQGYQSRWYVVNTKGALVKSGGGSGTPAPTTTSSGGGWG